MISASLKDNMTSSVSSTENHDWSTEEEIQLLFSFEGLKPVGVNKYFNVICIAERLSKIFNRDISTEAIWNHLHLMYNLSVLDKIESVPFPNEEKEFSLPDQEYLTLLSKKKTENPEILLSSEVTSSGPPSIIAVATDNTGKAAANNKIISNNFGKDLDKKVSIKMLEIPKRVPKRTRGSMSMESNSPSTTPPPLQNSKRRRI